MTRSAFNPFKPRVPGTVKACIVDLFAQAGGPKHVMVKLQLRESQVYAFTDQQSDEQISFARVAALTAPETAAAAEYLAALAGGVFQPVACAPGIDVQQLTAESARQHGEAVASLIGALADRRITPAEARTALVEIDDCVRGLCGLRALLLEASDQPPD